VVAQPDKNTIGKKNIEQNIVYSNKKTRIVHYFPFAKQVNFEYRIIIFKFSWICPVANGIVTFDQKMTSFCQSENIEQNRSILFCCFKKDTKSFE